MSTGIRYKILSAKAAANGAGAVLAVFSTFDIEDREGDIVRRTAFKNGQPVPLVWAHDWSKPIGKGIIRVETDRAVFDGRFNLATTAGREAYETVKEMGELQQYSWGFRVTETKPNPRIRGMDITGAEVFEVSPVLVGANPRTETLAIKSTPLPWQERAARQIQLAQAELAIMLAED